MPPTTKPILENDGTLFRVLNAINPAIPAKYRMIMIGALQGMKNTTIAEACGCDPTTVSHALARPDVQMEMTRLLAIRSAAVLDRTSELREKYEEVALEMLNVQLALARAAEEENVRAACARDVLAGAHRVMGIEGGVGATVPKLTIRTVVVTQSDRPGKTHVETDVTEVANG